MNITMNDRVALITGGSAGIGKATGLAFADAGAAVVVADVLEEEGEAVCSQIRDGGGQALFVLCDVSSPDAVEGLIGKAVSSFGRLDFAINNAGVEGEMATTDECSLANFDRTISINLRGLWLCLRQEIRQMLDQKGGGAIVNMSSVAGLVGFAKLPAYSASKHAIIGLTKCAALENATRGIRVNAICPGVIKTDMIDRITGLDSEVETNFIGLEPMARMGRSEEIASAALWLCSDAASFVTGHSLAVDGGLVAA